MSTRFPTRVASGVCPSGSVNAEQFFSSMQTHLRLQDHFVGDCIFFVADAHALTRPGETHGLRERTRHVARSYLALGLDPGKARLYRQSDVPAVFELMWILSCVTGKGLLDRTASIQQLRERRRDPSVGNYLYPELQAADILGVRATHVPVGAEERQHIEVARSIARAANTFVGDPAIFPEPTLVDTTSQQANDALGAGRVISDRGIGLPIFATTEALHQTIRSIPTDSVALGDPIDPDTDLTFHYFTLVASPDAAAELAESMRAGAVDHVDTKKRLEREFLDYFGEARDAYFGDAFPDDMLEDVLRDGAGVVGGEFQETLETVRDRIGLGW